MRVLVVEDEARIRSFLEKGLRAAGYAVEAASDADEALARVSAAPPDLAILDVMLPGRDGFALLSALRASAPGLPVIMLTARADVSDRVRGLDLGAVDYVVKPFAFDELLARVRAQLRRGGERADVLSAAGLELDLRTRELRADGRAHDLPRREFELLAYLLRHPGQVLSRQQILSAVWGFHFDPQSNVVDVYVGYLRERVGNDRIETVRGVGYRLRREP
jgi:DNA-binding response OmpR family regulator